VDPYNDFLSEGGKLWDTLRPVATEVRLLDNLRAVTAAARASGVVSFVVPHRRWEPGDYDDWDHPNPTQRAVQKRHSGRDRRTREHLHRVDRSFRDGARLSRDARARREPRRSARR